MQDIKDIEAALWEFEDGWGELGYMKDEEIEGINGLISGVENVGGMGKGEYRHVIFKIEHDGVSRHFKKVGCYVSHDGTYWDGPFTEVSAIQKTIVVWE